MSDPKLVDRKEAATILGVGNFHMGELIRKGKFPGSHKSAIPGRNTEKWWIPLDEVNSYAATRQSGVGKRADGRTKYTIYLTFDEMDTLTDKIASILGDEFLKGELLKRANPPKAKPAD